MPEVLRIRCPVCGMMTDLEQMEKAEQEKPTEVRLILQEFGGKVPVQEKTGPYKKVGRGGAAGHMKYTDVTEQHPDQVEKLKSWFVSRAKNFLGLS